ncbi:hypothetical protein DH2020_037089 [Rehmannia glutinosa]|uniref:non-specific serine/threonine protein kinase n=1 Tax=Rehmannia glutinosa TaxID=99300 RepID=A0ABR0V2X8_REHGL
MNLYPLSIALLFLCFVLTFTADASSNNPTHFTGDVSINCGSIGTSAASNGREWIGDLHPKLSSLLEIQGSSTTSTVVHKLISADPVPHRTARISRSQFSYAFQLNPGQKIIRLHFNPSTYRGFKGFRDLFTVEAGPFTLLSNFSASLTAYALGVNSISKEFCLNIHENQQFNLTFSPETSQLLDTYAFINGIEIISVPVSLSYFRGGEIGVQVVGQKSLVYVDYETALEIIHRLDAKHHSEPSTGNFDGMFPKWAMQKAYKRKNNTWKIAVDVGFRYLIRIHFSEIGLKIIGTGGDVMFKVLINGMIAQTNIDMVKERDENNIPWYRDYMVMMRGHKTEGKRDLLISLQSYDDLIIDGHVLLAGFEILKLSNPDNSLASLNPMPSAQDSPSHTIILISVLGYRNVIATVAITVISLVNIIVHKFREYGEANSTKEENKPSARAERLCRHFSLVEIQIATRNFSDALLIGRGGFGKVYKGHIDKGQKTVAVKRLKLNSNQGAHEFLMEIETLSELRHVNLVSLVGYCNERGEMILVYDYMAGGTLADQLYKIPRESNDCSSLTWKQRLNICIGAGRGLDYLHTGHGIIHRDVKASNILLDENFVAKVSDFGLAKIEDRSKLESHVSTKVKGTRGYLDPHYFNTCKITRKIDTYAFGVVLFEVLCGRPAVDSWLPEDERILANWGRVKSSKGEVDQIVDSSLRQEISPDSLKTFVGVAERCLHDEPKNRPTMSQVVLQLEFALEQQNNRQFLVLNEITSASDDTHPSSNDENDQSVNTDRQNATRLLKEQTGSIVVKTELPIGRKGGVTMYNPSRLWPWGSLWNRVRPSKKNELATNVRNLVIIFTDIGVPLTFENVVRATGNFHSSNCIGSGGFGATYKAEIAPGVLVAIKRLVVGRFQGFQQFDAEIKTLGRLRHPNLVTLIGYHVSETEMFLIYNYLPGGNLEKFLQERSARGVDWRVIHKIAHDISRALAYLHGNCVPRVIHRDVKPSHILLDEDHNACLSGFGLARLLKTSETHATTDVAGTFGYVAPEYAMTCRVSEKADVYSYGVVLLELLSDKKALDPSFSSFGNGFNIVAWACMLLRQGRAKEFFTAGLWDAGPHDDLVEVLHLAVVCTADSFSDRPAMKHVVGRLNQLQPASC